MMITIGEKIKNLREERNLTQKDFGEQVNMTQRKISYLECNKYEPSIDDIKAICMYFNISADYLLDLPSNLNYPGCCE